MNARSLGSKTDVVAIALRLSAAPAIASRGDASSRERLLLDVGLAVGFRRNRAADDARDRDQGQHVGKRLEERGGRARVDGQPVGERGREAEEERRAPGAERPPVAEDHRRERDEAAALRHVLGEAAAEVADREEGAAERRQHPGDDHRRVAHRVDVDPDRVGGAGMLAAGPDAQADRRLEEDERTRAARTRSRPR